MITRAFMLAYLFLFLIVFCACSDGGRGLQFSVSAKHDNDSLALKTKIGALLDSCNAAAGRADYDQYFSYFAEDAVYIGTDATEVWSKPAFMQWAKPFFDRKRAWDFHSLERHIYLSKDAEIAWFDELLDAPFAKICRGSGVLARQEGKWKMQQYVLSMTVPNQVGSAVTAIKSPMEDSLLHILKSSK